VGAREQVKGCERNLTATNDDQNQKGKNKPIPSITITIQQPSSSSPSHSILFPPPSANPAPLPTPDLITAQLAAAAARASSDDRRGEASTSLIDCLCVRHGVRLLEAGAGGAVGRAVGPAAAAAAVARSGLRRAPEQVRPRGLRLRRARHPAAAQAAPVQQGTLLLLSRQPIVTSYSVHYSPAPSLAVPAG
jgi:hypothetical protein